MLGRLWELIKRHPWLSVAIAVATIVIVTLISRRGGSAPQLDGTQVYGGSNAADVAAGVAMQQANLAAQTQIASGAQQLEALRITSGADYEKAKLQGQVSYNVAELYYANAADKLESDRLTATSLSSLAADVQKAGIAAQVQVAQIGAASAASYNDILKTNITETQKTQREYIAANAPVKPKFPAIANAQAAGFPIIRSIIGIFAPRLRAA